MGIKLKIFAKNLDGLRMKVWSSLQPEPKLGREEACSRFLYF
jgi:hypothetical protein